MKAGDILEALDKFFLDLIGTVLPGIALIYGTWLVLGQPLLFDSVSLFPLNDLSSWFLVIFTSYVLGHAVISLGENVVLPGLEFLISFAIVGRLTPQVMVPQRELYKEIETSFYFKSLVKKVHQEYSWLVPEDTAVVDVRSWRNLAMSINSASNYTVYRFMFISLLNLGMATALLFIAAFWILVNRMGGGGPPLNYWIIGALGGAAFLFLERRYRFYSRAIRVPFTSALVEVKKKEDKDNETGNVQENSSRVALSKKNVPLSNGPASPRVYLAGGFHSGWQDSLHSQVSQVGLVDPRTHQLKHSTQYVLWDLEAIRHSDIVFAYLEESNPAGYALALEVGFAKALGKRIVLVDEKSATSEVVKRYLAMVVECADIAFNDFDQAVEYMKKLEQAIAPKGL